MPKKATSLAVVLVAMCGAALAVFIPSASAAKSSDTYTQYCDNGTNTVYSEYSAYCTKTTPVTTVIEHDGISVTQAEGLTLDEILAPFVVVIKKTASGVTIDDYGTLFFVAGTDQLSIGADGTAFITKATASTVTFSIIMAPKQSVRQFSFFLPSGGSFDGTKTKLATINKLFTVYSTNSIASLRVAHAVKLTKVSHTVISAGAFRGNATLKDSKYLHDLIIKLDVKAVKYTKSEAAYLKKHKIKKLNAHVTFKSATGKSHIFKYTYPYVG